MMQYFFNKVKSHFVVILTLVSTVITKVKASENRCKFQNLVECTKPLSVLTDSGLPQFNNKSDMEKVCPNLKSAVRCIHGFTRVCMNKEDRLHFRKVFYGTGLMIHDLCKPGRYQDEYLRYAPCMINTSMEKETCFNTYTTTMDHLKLNSIEYEYFQSDAANSIKRKREVSNDVIKNICCAFQQYVKCSTSVVHEECGSETANFSLHFLKKMSSTMMNIHCTEYEDIGCGLIKSTISGTSLVKPTLAVLVLIVVIKNNIDN